MNNVLLVEDDYLDAMNVQRVFRKANIPHEITIARNGKEALQLLNAEEITSESLPDVILLDINMPKMNGFEFLKELRSAIDPKISQLKVFVITTSNDEAEREEAKALGVDGYVVKPFSFDNFEGGPSALDSFNLLCDLLKN